MANLGQLLIKKAWGKRVKVKIKKTLVNIKLKAY